MQEPQLEPQQPKEKRPTKKVVLKKIDPEAAKMLSELRERANKKPFGRKVKDSEIIRAALKLVTSEEIEALREATYSESDRLRMVHENYQKEFGRITLDKFIGKLMRGEVKTNN